MIVALLCTDLLHRVREARYVLYSTAAKVFRESFGVDCRAHKNNTHIRTVAEDNQRYEEYVYN